MIPLITNGSKMTKKNNHPKPRLKSSNLIKASYLLTFLNLIIFIWLMVASSLTTNRHQNPPIHELPSSYWQNTRFGWVDECLKSAFSNDSFNLVEDAKRLQQCQSDELKRFWRPPNDFFTFLPLNIIPSSNKKIISISLYGGADLYLHNVVKIIRKYEKLLPGWIPRFWLGSDVPFLMIERLMFEKAEVIIVHQHKPLTIKSSNDTVADRLPSFHGMFWRFFVADDENVEKYIVRDSDSMLIQREVDAINEWITENTMFHVMRDHPHHAIEILGGMWGGKVNTKIFSASREYGKALKSGYSLLDRKGLDQRYLQKYLWPTARKQMTCHTAYRWKFVDSRGCKDFPTKREGTSFIGSIMKI